MLGIQNVGIFKIATRPKGKVKPVEKRKKKKFKECNLEAKLRGGVNTDKLHAGTPDSPIHVHVHVPKKPK